MYSKTGHINRALGLFLLLLSSCSSWGHPTNSTNTQPPATTASPTALSPSTSAIASAEPAPPLPSPTSPVQEIKSSLPENPGLKGGIYTGSGLVGHPGSPKKAAANDNADQLSLNFVNADIHDVAKAVLGDMLGLNYVIAPGVQGTITLKINQPLPRVDIFPTLDAAFRLNGAAIVSADDVIKVVPIADAPRQARPVTFKDGHQTMPGYGMQIVPLRYTSSDEMQKILTQVTPAGGAVPVESAGNVIILTGTEEERAAMLDVISTFDVDWLAGMSFGLFPLKEADAKSVTHELYDVLGNSNPTLNKVVRLVAFDRLNAILAVSSQPRYLKEIKTWIDRLDINQAPSGKKIWVYRVQNGRASDLSNTLQKLMHEQGIKTADPLTAAATSTAQAALPFTMNAGNNGNPPTNNRIPPPPGADNLDSQTNEPSQGPRIIADETTNSLIIWASKSEFSLMEDALKKLDIMPLEVRIEAVVAEVTLTNDLKYGVQYLFQNKHIGTMLTDDSANAIGSPLAAGSNVFGKASAGFSAFVTGSHINAILDLLQDITTVHVISSPQLMVLNNQTATLQVGNQVPIATQSAVSVLTPGAPEVNTIEMKDTGVILKVTPRVNASGMVLMDIAQEVSDVTNTTSSTINSPTIEQRKIASSVAVRDGETIALGGLITDNRTNSKNGIPLLQDIPGVGFLFGTTTKDATRTELLALITPRVVKNDEDVRLVTAEMREQMSAVTPLDAEIHH